MVRIGKSQSLVFGFLLHEFTFDLQLSLGGRSVGAVQIHPNERWPGFYSIFGLRSGFASTTSVRASPPSYCNLILHNSYSPSVRQTQDQLNVTGSVLSELIQQVGCSEEVCPRFLCLGILISEKVWYYKRPSRNASLDHASHAHDRLWQKLRTARKTSIIETPCADKANLSSTLPPDIST